MLHTRIKKIFTGKENTSRKGWKNSISSVLISNGAHLYSDRRKRKFTEVARILLCHILFCLQIFFIIQSLSPTIRAKRSKISEHFYMLTFKLSSELNIWKAQKFPNSRRLEVNQTMEAFIRFAFLYIRVWATCSKVLAH